MTGENKQETLDIRQILQTCINNWYWFVVSVVLCAGLMVLYIFSTTPKYDVSSTIVIRTQDENGNGMLPSDLMSVMGMGANKQVVDELHILNSRTIMHQVIEDLGVQTEYRKKDDLRWVEQYPAHDIDVVYPAQFTDTMRFNLRMNLRYHKESYTLKVEYGKHSSKHKVTSITEPIMTCAGPISFKINRELESGAKYEIITRPMPVQVDVYRTNITGVQAKKESNVIQVSTVTDCPRKATDMINKMIDLYNWDAVSDKNIMASNTREFVVARLAVVAQELDSIENVLAKYKKDNKITVIATEVEVSLKNAGELQTKRVEVETQIDLMDYIAEFIFKEENKHALIPVNLGISDPALVSVIESYNELILQRMRIQRTATSANPLLGQIDEQLAMMRTNVINSINGVREGLQISKRQLLAQESLLSGRMGDVPAQEREFVEIYRQQQIKQKMYVFLSQKKEENDITLASTVMPAKIIDKAQMAPEAVSPRKLILLLLAGILGLAIPAAVLYFYSLLYNLVTDHKEYERLIRAPFLGQLAQSKQKTAVVVTANENSPSAELFRLLRTNIRFMLPANQKSHVLLVTSAVPGEGKSFVAINLATSLALLDKKVCLVGLDVRKPMLAEYLNLSSRGALTAYIAESAYELDDILMPSGVHENLDVIPAGIVPPNPNELLQSERLDELMATLRERYDYVIVDSAPTAMVSDTFLLGRLVDATIFVSRANHTPREMTEFINDIYNQKRLPSLACVLNGVKATQAGYGYGYGYK